MTYVLNGLGKICNYAWQMGTFQQQSKTIHTLFWHPKVLNCFFWFRI